MRHDFPVTIFEGPDGSGKTTLAKWYAEKTRAVYVHCGPVPDFDGKMLQQYYLDAMEPALRGRRPVVMDRCWVSEPIYGCAFRGGLDRLGAAKRVALEMTAAARDAVVVLCRPPLETCLTSWRARHADGDEYVTAEAIMTAIWQAYGDIYITGLPVVNYDYTRDNRDELVERVLAL